MTVGAGRSRLTEASRHLTEESTVTTAPAEHPTAAWCCGCHAETDHEPAVDSTRRSDGLCRRTLVCKECRTVTSSTVEISEAEYDCLRRWVGRRLEISLRSIG